MRTYSSLMLAGAVLATSLTAVNFAQAAGPLDQQIVNTAQGFMGKRVGSGQCTDFVSEVLRLSNAKGITYEKWTVVVNKKVTKIDSYGWGKRYVQLGKNRPPLRPKAGNIMQFESCHFEYRNANSWGSYDYGIPHHTAIVKSVNGSVVTLLHQNAPVGGPVVEATIDLSWLKSGHYKFYEAIPQ